jgi:hypothetical protein
VDGATVRDHRRAEEVVALLGCPEQAAARAREALALDLMARQEIPSGRRTVEELHEDIRERSPRRSPALIDRGQQQ